MAEPVGRVLPWLIAVVAVIAAALVRVFLDQYLGPSVPFLIFLPAVAVAAWYGGLWPGVLCILLSCIAAAWLFVSPPPTRQPFGQDVVTVVRFTTFVAVSAFIVAICEAYHRSQRRSDGAIRPAAPEATLFQITLSSIGDAVIATDIRGCVTFMNSVAESVTGWRLSEAGNLPLTTVFHIVNEQTRKVVEDPCSKALRLGVVVGLANHTVLISRDGTERPIDDSAAPIRDEHGNVSGVVLVFRDVTDRRRAEDALRRSERELTDFFDNANVGLHWLGPDGTIQRVNQEELNLLGYSRDEFVGRHIAEFHVDRPEIDGILARLARGETLSNQPARMRCRDESVRDVLINANGLFDDGKFIRSRCFVLDVTELKRAQEAQARLAAVVESSEDAIISKTLDGTILTWNSGAERLFGYSVAEAVGQPITLIAPPGAARRGAFHTRSALQRRARRVFGNRTHCKGWAVDRHLAGSIPGARRPGADYRSVEGGTRHHGP